MNTSDYINKYSSKWSVILILVSFLILLYNSFLNNVFWYEEAYTASVIKYPFSEIWAITSKDVNPPLYYFMLKVFTLAFGDSIAAIRLFSALGIIATLLLGLFPIKRLFGPNVSFTFILLMTLMPATQYFGIEAKMYSWAMFFVLGCGIYAYEITIKGTLTNYTKATAFAICAAYTHYYALIAVSSVFIVLCIFLLLRDRMIIRLLLFLSLFFIAYSPWIPEFSEQIQSVRNEFWVDSPTAKDLLIYCYYFFSPKEPSHPYMIFNLPVMSVALTIMLLIVCAFIISIIKLHFREKNKKIIIADGYILIYLLTLAITFIITFTIEPISVPRYTGCLLGILVLGISIYISKTINIRHIRRIVIAGISLLAILSIARFFSEKAYYQKMDNQRIQTEFFLRDDSSETKYIVANYASFATLAELSAMFPKDRCILITSDENVGTRPFNIKIWGNPDELNQFYYVKMNTDNSSLEHQYNTINKIEFDKYSISLLQK